LLEQNKKWTQPADNHNTTRQFDPTIYNTTKINRVSLPSFSQVSTDLRVIQTTKNLTDEFPFNLDMIPEFHLGIGVPIPHS